MDGLARAVLQAAVIMKKIRTQQDTNRKPGKLALRIETVRKLNELPAEDLEQVVGGMTTSYSRITQLACG